MSEHNRAPKDKSGRRATRESPRVAATRFRELQLAEDDVSGQRLLLATLRIRIPKGLWTGLFSSGNPNVRMEVLNRADVSKDVSVSDYWISGQPPGVWAREIARYPDVIKVDSLAEVGEGCLYRITYRNPPIIYFYRKLGMPIQLPIHIQGGLIHWEVAARHMQFQEVLDHVRKVDPGFQVVSLRRRPLRNHLPMLTDSQHNLLTQAMAAGYFAVPRAITLTDLAKRLDRSKSGISEAIAIIERKLLESAMRPTPLTA
ncbi:MAG: helix-turn-helix domain-containing protein [Thermoplasmata archaeon]